MTNFYKKRLLVVTLICLSNFGFSQSNEIKIRFIGNAGLNLTDGKTNIYVDFPYKSGAHNYMEYNQSELDSIKDNSVFLFTHRHSDHYSKKLLRKFSGKKYGNWNTDELKNLNDSIQGFSIEAFKTSHKFTFKHYSYLITWHNKKIFISGDTENSETLASQTAIDWAFIPAWLTTDARDKGIKLGAISKMYAIYHIGPNDKITNDKKDPQIKLLDKQGEIITIPY